jgi:hypothetical protein
MACINLFKPEEILIYCRLSKELNSEFLKWKTAAASSSTARDAGVTSVGSSVDAGICFRRRLSSSSALHFCD